MFLNRFTLNTKHISKKRKKKLAIKWPTKEWGDKSFCQLGISSNCCLANLSFCQTVFSSNCNFIEMSFDQMAVLSTCHFIKLLFSNMSFCQIVTRQIVISLSCQLIKSVISSNSCLANLSFY
jgi:hypothetical protein